MEDRQASHEAFKRQFPAYCYTWALLLDQYESEVEEWILKLQSVKQHQRHVDSMRAASHPQERINQAQAKVNEENQRTDRERFQLHESFLVRPLAFDDDQMARISAAKSKLVDASSGLFRTTGDWTR